MTRSRRSTAQTNIGSQGTFQEQEAGQHSWQELGMIETRIEKSAGGFVKTFKQKYVRIGCAVRLATKVLRSRASLPNSPIFCQSESQS